MYSFPNRVLLDSVLKLEQQNVDSLLQQMLGVNPIVNVSSALLGIILQVSVLNSLLTGKKRKEKWSTPASLCASLSLLAATETFF